MRHTTSKRKFQQRIIPRILILTMLMGLLGLPASAPVRAAHPLHVAPGGAGDVTCEDWANACDLQDAISQANPGDEIWVAQGVYKPTFGSGREVTFQLKNGVAIYGGFAGNETSLEERDFITNVTILSGDIDNNDITENNIVVDTDNIQGENAYHVVTGSDVGNTAILDGFTITAGKANNDSVNRGQNGGGMICDEGSPTLENIIFSGNYANYGGGMDSEFGDPTLTNVTFIHNAAVHSGGGMNSYANNSTILTNVTFIDNTAGTGGGLITTESSPTLVNVIFQGNRANYQGGGIEINIFSNPTLINVIFIQNSAGRGGGIEIYNSGGSMTNVAFYANSATLQGGGGISVAGGSATLTNVTFNANSSSSSYWGSALSVNGTTSLNNCIVWGNPQQQGLQISIGDEDTLTINHSLIEDGCPAGATCNDPILTTDPLFVDASSGNLRLSSISPAIDAGDNTAPGLIDVTTDLASNPRFVDISSIPDSGIGPAPIVDLGAYEVQVFIAKYYTFLPLIVK